MITTILNAIYPPMIILMIGFFCSVLFYVFLKLVAEDAPVRYALFYTIAWLIIPFISVIELVSIILFNRGMFVKVKKEKFSLRILIAVLFFPYIFYKLLSNPVKSVNYLVDFCRQGIKELNLQPTKVRKTNQSNLSVIELIDTMQRIVNLFEKVKTKMNIRHV